MSRPRCARCDSVVFSDAPEGLCPACLLEQGLEALSTDGNVASCVVVTAGGPELGLHVEKAACGGAAVSGPYDIIRGHVGQLQCAVGSVDLGNVVCAAGSHPWDRMTDLSPDPNPACNDTVLFYLARATGAADFGSAWPNGEPRDVMTPDPVCP